LRTSGGVSLFVGSSPTSGTNSGARSPTLAEAALLKRALLRVRLPPRALFVQGDVCKWRTRLDLQSSALSGFAGSSPAVPVDYFVVAFVYAVRHSPVTRTKRVRVSHATLQEPWPSGRGTRSSTGTTRVRVPPAPSLSTVSLRSSNAQSGGLLSRTVRVRISTGASSKKRGVV
jgi:hypothetical protein